MGVDNDSLEKTGDNEGNDGLLLILEIIGLYVFVEILKVPYWICITAVALIWGGYLVIFKKENVLKQFFSKNVLIIAAVCILLYFFM